MGRLSDREFEVFQMIGEGKGTREIAAALHLSVKTVEVHRSNMKKKAVVEKRGRAGSLRHSVVGGSQSTARRLGSAFLQTRGEFHAFDTRLLSSGQFVSNGRGTK